MEQQLDAAADLQPVAANQKETRAFDATEQPMIDFTLVRSEFDEFPGNTERRPTRLDLSDLKGPGRTAHPLICSHTYERHGF